MKLRSTTSDHIQALTQDILDTKPDHNNLGHLILLCIILSAYLLIITYSKLTLSCMHCIA